MIQEIKMEGFRSFLNETTLSLQAQTNDTLRSSNVYQNILKGVLFIGGNGTGKSNVMESIHFLLDLLYDENNVDLSRYFCYFSKKKEIRLTYSFVFPKQKIVYHFIIDEHKKTIQEELKINDVLFNLPESNHQLKLSSILQEQEELKELNQFLQNSFHMDIERHIKSYREEPITLLGYLKEYGTKELNTFLLKHHFGFSVVYEEDIYIQKEGREEKLPLYLESIGIVTLLNLLPCVFYLSKYPGMLLIDEFTIGFHHRLEELFIRIFMKNTVMSQFIFASHSTNLLKTTLLRLDQIYVTSFDTKKGSQIVPISFFHPRESQNIEKMYLSGMFEGLPLYEDE